MHETIKSIQTGKLQYVYLPPLPSKKSSIWDEEETPNINNVINKISFIFSCCKLSNNALAVPINDHHTKTKNSLLDILDYLS